MLTDTLGAAQSGATVTVTDTLGSLTLAEDSGSPGTYRASRSGYSPGTLTLDVSVGSAQVTGVQVVAPDIHTITSPAANQTIQANHPIQMTWTMAAAALEAWYETKDMAGAPTTDNGRVTVPTPANPARPDQRFSVIRLNRTSITSAASGSTFEASVRNSVEPVNAQ